MDLVINGQPLITPNWNCRSDRRSDWHVVRPKLELHLPLPVPKSDTTDVVWLHYPKPDGACYQECIDCIIGAGGAPAIFALALAFKDNQVTEQTK